jgi:exodeoxyribonuclease V alpha subunit
LQWLQGSGIDVRTGKKLLAFFGNEAEEKLAEDPYRLLSFSASWKSVDAFARARFNVAEDDPRRLQAAVEEALYRLFDGGDTVTPIPSLMKRVEAILGGSMHRSLVMSALEAGLTNGSYVIGDDGNVHLLGAMFMERTVAKALAMRLRLAPLLSAVQVNELIHEYEQGEGFDLNAEQKQAVHLAVENPFAVILGGAGVGKTTVLKAVLKAYEAAGVGVHQMALSGRAAKRMTEATGLPSSTLARFFKNADSLDLEDPAVVVVDEASMVDIVTMHRLCELLPEHVRILLVGDTSQLMPVGPGLILHALERIPEIPVIELVQVKRYGGAIAAAAADIRAGRWPSLPDDGVSAISFVPTKVADIPAIVVALYESDKDNTQILSGRKGNADGVQSLNELCQLRFAKQGPALLIPNEEFGMDMSAGFHLGDPLLCTRNLWDWGLQNGSLGTLVEIEKAPRLLSKPDGTELGHALAWVNWDDGERRPITAEMLPDLELGYALTIHKSQGSQWRRIVVVLTGSRMLDRTLIYTAITRAQEQVIIVGDEAAAKAAVEAPPRAELRNVGLAQFLTQEIAANSEAALLRA